MKDQQRREVVTKDERAEAELRWTLIGALSAPDFGTAWDRIRLAMTQNTPLSENESSDWLYAARTASQNPDANLKGFSVTHQPARRILEEGVDPLHAAFLARALNAVADLLAALPDAAICEAVSAPSDADALLCALERAPRRTAASDEIEAVELLNQARARGIQSRERLLTTEGGTLSVSEVAEHLHLTRQAVDDRRKKGALLGLAVGRRGYRYPAWQFGDSGVLTGLQEILEALRRLDPWTQVAFMLNPNARLGGETPLLRLRSSHPHDVAQAARAYGEQGA